MKTNPYIPTTADADSESKRSAVQGPRSLRKRLAMAAALSLVVLASGPLLWLGLLVMFGAIAGDATRVFTNRVVWEDEFVSKLPAALLVSSAGAISVIVGVLSERSPRKVADDAVTDVSRCEAIVDK